MPLPIPVRMAKAVPTHEALLDQTIAMVAQAGLEKISLRTIAARSGFTTPPPNAATDSEIIVTAQRRSESLQRTPVAVSVLSSATLQKQAIVSEADLQIASLGRLRADR